MVYHENLNITKSAIMKLLTNINDEDNLLIQLRGNRTAKINYEFVRSETNKGDDLDVKNEQMAFIFENVYDSMVNHLSRGDWDYKYNLFAEFFKINGRLPKHRETYININLGYWYALQKHNYKFGKLSKDRKEKLDLITLDWNKSSENEWNINHKLLLEFYEINKRIPKIRETYNGIFLGSWNNTQKRKYRLKKLSKDKIDKLNSIAPDWNKFKEDKWDIYYKSLSEFYDINKRLPKQKEIYNGINLGYWIQNKRQRYDILSKDKIDKLNLITPDWAKDKNEETWYNNYELLLKFFDVNKRLPRFYNTSGDELMIATWMNNQKNRKNQLGEYRLNKLKLIPGIISDGNSILEDKWEIKFQLLFNYYKINNKLPSSHIIYMGESIGEWLSNQIQRGRKGILLNDRIEKLNQITGWNKKTIIIPYQNNKV